MFWMAFFVHSPLRVPYIYNTNIPLFETLITMDQEKMICTDALILP